MERFKVMKASGSKHSLNKYYGATAEDLENTAGLLEMTSVLGNSQIDENASGRLSTIVVTNYSNILLYQIRTYLLILEYNIII